MMPEKTFPITAEVTYADNKGLRFWMSADDMLDELREKVCQAVKGDGYERDVVPRGPKPMFEPNMFVRCITMEFEFADTHELVLRCVACFHMPIDCEMLLQ
jgi:hypothetical protein